MRRTRCSSPNSSKGCYRVSFIYTQLTESIFISPPLLSFLWQQRTEFSLAYVGLILFIRNTHIYNELFRSEATLWHSLPDNNLSKRIVFHPTLESIKPTVSTLHHPPVIRPDWTFISTWFLATFPNLIEKDSYLRSLLLESH